MLTYQVPAAILGPLCPAGVCLDLHHDTALVSVVGFRFLNTRLFHIPIPFHRNFDEVNLRFYVRREMPDGEIRRGVCFVRELVPRRSIASIARRAYQEPYIAVAMRSTAPSELVNSPGRISYSWQWSGKWDHVAATAVGSPAEPADPLAAFVTDHYWGYTRQRDGSTIEYRVIHRPWRIWHAESPELCANVEESYGPSFVEYLKKPPVSAIVAEGSPVTVHRPRRIDP